MSMDDDEAGGCVGLLLAAGLGRRFDPSGRASKLEQSIDGLPVAIRALQSLGAGCAQVIAVVRDEDSTLAAALRQHGAVLTRVEGQEQGMGFSIAAGARAIRALGTRSAVLLMPADMPGVNAASILRIARTPVVEADGIVVPTHAGGDGHPVRFPACLLDELAACSGDVGARALLSRHPVHRIALDDPGIVADIDHPCDLSGWKKN